MFLGPFKVIARPCSTSFTLRPLQTMKSLHFILNVSQLGLSTQDPFPRASNLHLLWSNLAATLNTKSWQMGRHCKDHREHILTLAFQIVPPEKRQKQRQNLSHLAIEDRGKQILIPVHAPQIVDSTFPCNLNVKCWILLLGCTFAKLSEASGGHLCWNQWPYADCYRCQNTWEEATVGMFVLLRVKDVGNTWASTRVTIFSHSFIYTH